MEKRIYEYEDIKGEHHALKVNNINSYLVDGKNSLLPNRKKPICFVPEIIYGSFALDDGLYTLSDGEKNEIIKANPDSTKVIKPFIGGRELLHNEKRFCLWLVDAIPDDINKNIVVRKRVEAFKIWREKSKRINTKKLASTPTLFAEIRQPNRNYLAFPTVSSEKRNYIPIAFLPPEIIASNQLYILPKATLFDFGILTSEMHMTWVHYVCGRLESRYRYSNTIVYNNFPWPESPSEKQIKTIEEAAQKVLDIRTKFPSSSLADLYDPLTMPPKLVKAHQELDKAVDLCYRPQPFPNETKRIEFLFELYDKYTAGLFAKEKKTRMIKKEPNNNFE